MMTCWQPYAFKPYPYPTIHLEMQKPLAVFWLPLVARLFCVTLSSGTRFRLLEETDQSDKDFNWLANFRYMRSNVVLVRLLEELIISSLETEVLIGVGTGEIWTKAKSCVCITSSDLGALLVTIKTTGRFTLLKCRYYRFNWRFIPYTFNTKSGKTFPEKNH